MIVHCSQSLTRAYIALGDRIRGSPHALRSIPEEERRIKEILDNVSSTLGIQCIIVFFTCIVQTTTGLYMLLVEADYSESPDEDWDALSPFLALTLYVWIPTLIIMKGFQMVSSSVIFSDIALLPCLRLFLVISAKEFEQNLQTNYQLPRFSINPMRMEVAFGFDSSTKQFRCRIRILVV